MNQSLPPTEDHEPGDPEWLHQMRGWEDTPDWLRKLIRSNEQRSELAATDSPAGSTPDVDIGALDLDDTSDRVDHSDLVNAIASADAQEAARRELEQAAEVPPPQPEPSGPSEVPLAPEEEEDLDWLDAIDANRTPAAEDEADSALLPELEGDDIPDWLQRMSPAAEASAPASTEARAPLPRAEDRDIPDWLRDLGPASQAEMEDDENAPEWLAELDQAAETDLEGVLAEAIGPTAETPPEKADGTETPDWLLDLAQEAEQDKEGEGIPVSPPQPPSERLSLEAEAEPEAPPPGKDEQIPDWLADMAGQAAPELAEGETTDELGAAQALPTIEDILGEAPEMPLESDQAEGLSDAAEWLYAVEQERPPQEPLLEFAEGEFLYDETPEWIDELRVQEQATAELELAVETSGPLAGLRGLLDPDPLLSLTPKAKYAATPPVPDAQQEQARLLRKFLAAPSKRPDVAAAPPERATMQAAGRWVIYAALLAAICAAIFVPALQEWIQPPQTIEAGAFFSAVGGLPQGSAVLLVVDYDASHDGELTPQTRAILWHLLNRDLGVMIVSHTPQGAAIVQDLVRDDLRRALGKAYIPGEHYLNLGYIPPHAALLQAFMADPLSGATLWGAVPAEAAQTPLGQRVAGFDDLSLIVLVSSSQEHVRWWVEQTAIGGSQSRIVAGVSASVAPYLLPYSAGTTSGQIEGLLVGLAGAAEYERLAGAQFWPNARENLILLGYAQLLLAAIVLASGIRSVFGRSKGT